VRTLLDKNLISSAAVIDCDLHQGDGTAWIFRDDPRVFTLSLHQRSAFPYPKKQSTLDVELEDYTNDEEYLKALDSALNAIFDNRKHPDLLHYQAGADPYSGDTLGKLNLSIAGLLARDKAVIGAAAARQIPIVVTLGGGLSGFTAIP
jgi:acetoin utilization deacetylase AcuC-like enzyme